MNPHLLEKEVQDFILAHLDKEAHRIALSVSPFPEVTSTELAGQILSKKKASSKLPSWFSNTEIYYPKSLSIEQSSSEITAAYKASLIKGELAIDLTAGFGVDSYYFSRSFKRVISCEVNEDLSEIAAWNAKKMGINSIQSLATDGISFLRESDLLFDLIYLDPARRQEGNKVFRLKDCHPDVTQHLTLLLERGKRVMIKTSPLLDLSAGMQELSCVHEIHIVSTKNECKELLWILGEDASPSPLIYAVTLNEQQKTFTYSWGCETEKATTAMHLSYPYLYEPDAALLKSGAFDLIAHRYRLLKLHTQTQLYVSDQLNEAFPGRIFRVNEVWNMSTFKKKKELSGNVICRQFPEKPETLQKRYRIQPSEKDFLIFTRASSGLTVISARIVQYY